MSSRSNLKEPGSFWKGWWAPVRLYQACRCSRLLLGPADRNSLAPLRVSCYCSPRCHPARTPPRIWDVEWPVSPLIGFCFSRRRRSMCERERGKNGVRVLKGREIVVLKSSRSTKKNKGAHPLLTFLAFASYEKVVPMNWAERIHPYL